MHMAGRRPVGIHDVSRVLEQSRILSCVVGVSALIFYDVPRVQDVCTLDSTEINKINC